MRNQFDRELNVAQQAALAAGARVLDFYRQQSAAVYEKSDGTAVTDADLAADEIIRGHLASTFPNDAILTEESEDDRKRLDSDRCWIVDPIDGTNQFINRTGEFDVLIALVVLGRPVVGVAYQPTEDVLWSAAAGHGATVKRGDHEHPLHFRPVAAGNPMRIATSTWLGAPENLVLLDRVAKALHSKDVVVSRVGVNLRRFTTEEEPADVFIGLHLDDVSEMASEWDFAAPDIIVEEAGGMTTNLDGNPHQYNKPVPRNFGGLVMSRDPETHQRIVDALRSVRSAPNISLDR